ncbi:winged helix-turn-helix transcriptional regulator [Mangrovihabitans endophyticus]|uniref:HxlR family transcriptional regulator n=1 Tax=Mangrovihabitans endophyticus TaxID=1751298 RepID=A0A8J3FQD6_9ACTN|nr:helix-turn-helix domain-containing protein [Mangrovihabitans endophyticus]GGL02497.1 HxlR family transcriptional regulator [Mangrovihabitans endophyticus]
MGASYHSFCPVAKAMELLDERWTMLVVNELTHGPRRFNELRRGLPRMSPTLLSKRLHQLSTAGVVARDADEYHLTEAGQELSPVVTALGAWGIRWIGHLGDQDLNPKLLMWHLYEHVEHEELPAGRTVVEFCFTDVRPPHRHRWWLVLTRSDADVCDADPGFDVSVTVESTLRRMVEIFRGDSSWAGALRSGAVTLHGPAELRRAMPGWIRQSGYAAVPRRAT